MCQCIIYRLLQLDSVFSLVMTHNPFYSNTPAVRQKRKLTINTIVTGTEGHLKLINDIISHCLLIYQIYILLTVCYI